MKALLVSLLLRLSCLYTAVSILYQGIKMLRKKRSHKGLDSYEGKSLKLLSVMDAIRLDDKDDKIETTLSLALAESANGNVTNRSIISSDPLASSTWEEVTGHFNLIQVRINS
ncbi:protein ROOT HAIR DEFECTIVE 3-like isoform X2 [Magnolia sinica]|uniref:protein ROOT HAIR DEFECTIVE 3-like isoform X2 n=1 Tax=Magnolia sinica TaxID=86752 RepID=UPI002657BA1A|nr:protein ROOT HAIR DEFECTIVE 3-like isoform X2 [Magnolia sinica]